MFILLTAVALSIFSAPAIATTDPCAAGLLEPSEEAKLWRSYYTLIADNLLTFGPDIGVSARPLNFYTKTGVSQKEIEQQIYDLERDIFEVTIESMDVHPLPSTQTYQVTLTMDLLSLGHWIKVITEGIVVPPAFTGGFELGELGERFIRPPDSGQTRIVKAEDFDGPALQQFRKFPDEQLYLFSSEWIAYPAENIFPPELKTRAEYEAALDQWHQEIRSSHAKIRKDFERWASKHIKNLTVLEPLPGYRMLRFICTIPDLKKLLSATDDENKEWRNPISLEFRISKDGSPQK